MQLIPVDNICLQDWFRLNMDSYADLLSMTVQVYELRSPNGEVNKGYVGLMKTEFLSDNVWLWFVPGAEPYTFSELRGARKAARRFRERLSGNIFAETSDFDPVAEKFARYVGFVPEAQENNRTLYRWN